MLREPPPWLSKVWELTGILGVVLALVSALLFGIAVGPWFRTLADTLEITSEAIDAVETTIEVVDEALVVFSDTMVGVGGVFDETSLALADTSGVILSSGALLQDEIPGQIESIESAMDGLIDTANVVDGILSALSFVGVDYDPEIPLDEALIDVNTKLSDVGESLAGFSSDLFALTVTVNRLNDEIGLVDDSLAGLEGQVARSRTLISEYRVAAGEARELISGASERLTPQVWLVRVLGIALLLLLSPIFALMWWVGRSQRPEDATSTV